MKIFLLSYLFATSLLAQTTFTLCSFKIFDNTVIDVQQVATELDVIVFKNRSFEAIPEDSIWSKIFKGHYIFDYNHKVKDEIKTETSNGYFILLKTKKNLSHIDLKIFKGSSAKVLIRSQLCFKKTN